MGNCEGKDYGLKNSPIYQNDIGRFAGHDHVDPDGLETIDDWRCTENCPVRKLGEQTSHLHSAGNAKATGGHNRQPNRSIFDNSKGGIGQEGYGGARHGDKGTAARFFFQADWSYERIEWEELWGGEAG